MSCKLSSSSKKLRGLSAHAQVRVEAFSIVPCCEGFLIPASFTQRDEEQRITVQCMASVSERPVSHHHSPFSSPCRAFSRRATRGRSLKPHVAVGHSVIRRADANALFAKLGGATGLCLSLHTTFSSLISHVVPTLAASSLASFGALRERKGAFDA